MTKRDELGALLELEIEMNKREDSRIPVQLPCRLLFPEIWSDSLGGFTANLHREGVLIACDIKKERELPALGDSACVHIELPATHNFPPKFMRCATTLLRISQLGEEQFELALEIKKMDFADISAESMLLMKLDPQSCRYLM